MVDAYVFDVDGTLLDSVDQHAHAWKDALFDFGHDVPFKKLRAQIGKGGDQLMPVFLSRREIDLIGARLDEHRAKILHERYFQEISPFPKVRELFQRLLADGKQIALASSASKDDLEKYKQIAGIEDLLDAQTSSDDAEKSKPDPDIFEVAVSRLKGVERSAVVAVGDTPYDAKAATSAGLRAIGFLSGGWSEVELRRSGCTEIYRNPADMLPRYGA